MKKLLEALAATVEVMGQQISPIAISMMAKDLSVYRPDDVIAALQIVRTGSQRFSLKAIVDALDKVCPDGRPGADEAWAMIPRDEHVSAVMTEEMSEAMGIAQPLLDEGDQVAARMAFKDAYNRIVETNKMSGVDPKWFPSLGCDAEMRVTVMNEAVRLGRLTADHAAKSVPAISAPTSISIGDKREISQEQINANIARLRNIVGGITLRKAA